MASHSEIGLAPLRRIHFLVLLESPPGIMSPEFMIWGCGGGWGGQGAGRGSFLPSGSLSASLAGPSSECDHDRM